MTNDELILSPTLSILREPAVGDRAPSSRKVGLGGFDATHATGSSSLGNHARRRCGAVRRTATLASGQLTGEPAHQAVRRRVDARQRRGSGGRPTGKRTEEDTAELPSLAYFVCRLLL